MPTKIWVGGSAAIADEYRLTPAAVAVGATFTATVNGKSVTYTAPASPAPTVATVTSGLAAALGASAEPEFREFVFTDAQTYVRAVGPADGTPVVITSSATGGATLTTSHPTTAVSPNDWGVAANWDGGALPVAGDAVVIDNSPVSIRFGLDQSGVALASVTTGAGFTGEIGLPDRNRADYDEWRRTYLKLNCATLNSGAGAGPGSSLIRLESSVAATLNVFRTGAPRVEGQPALYWKGSAASTVNVVSGYVGVAAAPGETATLTKLRVGGGETADANVVGGQELQLENLELDGGTVALKNSVMTVRQLKGTLVMTGQGTAQTLAIDGGTVYWESAGLISVLLVAAGGVCDFTRDLRPRIVINCTIQRQDCLNDDFGTVTWQNGITFNRTALLRLGTHVKITLQPAA
jgi:hypothetical protein